MAPRHIYASSLNRRDRSWRRTRRHQLAWYPVWVVTISVVLTQALRVFG